MTERGIGSTSLSSTFCLASEATRSLHPYYFVINRRGTHVLHQPAGAGEHDLCHKGLSPQAALWPGHQHRTAGAG